MDLSDQLYKYLDKLYRGQGSIRLYRKYLPFLEQAGPDEINQAVDRLVKKGYSMESMEKPVARFTRALSPFLDRKPPLQLPKQHFIYLMMQENLKIREWMERLKPVYKSLMSIKAFQSPESPRLQKEILRCLKSLQSMENHYIKMQYIVFPRMESIQPEHRCIKLLWHLQDKALKQLKQLISELSSPAMLNMSLFNRKYGEMYFTLSSLIYREEKILYPLLIKHLPPQEFMYMAGEARDTGWAFGIEAVENSENSEMTILPEENRKEEHQNELERIIHSMNQSENIPRVNKQIRKDFSRLLKELSPDEILQAEQALIEQGIPVEEVQQLCEIHVYAFEDKLNPSSGRDGGESKRPGHPVATYKAENKALKKHIRMLSRRVKRTKSAGDWQGIKDGLEEISQVELHFQRKENQLFPFLEWMDFTGPSKIMWGKHDEIREILDELKQCIDERNAEDVRILTRKLSIKLKRMIFMEEKILFPSAVKKLSQSQWASIRKGEAEIGYAWITPGNRWDP